LRRIGGRIDQVFRPVAQVQGLDQAVGHWVRRDLIAWPAWTVPHGTDPASLEWRLHWSEEVGIDPAAPEPLPWPTATLLFDPAGLDERTLAAFPHLRGYLALRLPSRAVAGAPEILRCQVAVSVHAPSGRPLRASALQLPGVLDDLYASAANAVLGPSWDAAGTPTLRLWAPTARDVTLLRWPAGTDLHAQPELLAMEAGADGTWAVTGGADWLGSRYRYRVLVYTGHHHRVVANEVTDPYSTALTVNSTHSVLVDLDAPELVPDQWLAMAPPRLEQRVDQVVYELHLRDFSVHDSTVPEHLRGSFLAATCDSAGMKHLRRLAAAGLNTVQLLPLFDNATVEEHPARQLHPPKDVLLQLPPDSPEQQRLVEQSRASADFNWGYDPWHFFVPEGSFASTLEAADGGGRISECRAMIGAFHAAGLRVVLDQVFNHTASSGQDSKSVLDRIVPGYYHRLDATGEVENSTCCANVATEHLMAGKLMTDACVLWVRHYRVDGFRFDLMGHHSRANLLALRAALDALTLERDGVDGRAVTLYGEGWNFGEVADNARFVQASQGQLGGTGIGTFNDRLRDAVRGGSVWDADPRGQGLGTGLLIADNGTGASGDQHLQAERLARYTDLATIGLAGGLRDFGFFSLAANRWLTGADLDYGGRPAGYADQPDEVVNYVDAHDNETLFDALTLKLHPATSMADRVRQNTVCLALATLGQGPVLWHAGVDMLRSKSLDANSYASGDWFNFLDFSMRDNGFGAGLPPEQDNAGRWQILGPLLANPRLKPKPAQIRAAHAAALELLRLRASSRLLRLGDAALIGAKVSFPTAGTWQHQAGVLVMRIDDVTDPVDPVFSGLVTVFNTTPFTVRQSLPFDASGFGLHPVQAHSADPVVREAAIGTDWATVPARTVAVFVRPR
jgi:pullulanase-type alpha-1,6-glucosidase